MINIAGASVLIGGEDDQITTNICCDDGVISHIGETQIGKTIDGSGLILAPGIIDLGVFSTDKPAFRFGGITRAALMPDQNPVHDDPATIRYAALKGKPDFWVHPLAAATKNLEGTQLAEIALMKEAGAMGVATGHDNIIASETMLRVMEYCAALDLPLFVHSEDIGLTRGSVATTGETATMLGLSNAPSLSEVMSISSDMYLAEEADVHIHYRQVTTKRGLDLIRKAKSRGLRVTCGITPAHLFLSDTAMTGFRTFTRLSPPLRSEDDRLACIEAIADGTIDVIASGHDPRAPEEKRLPFSEATPGMAGAETLLSLSMNLVRDGHISMNRLFDLLSRNPAKILGINAGDIKVGLEADLILIEADAMWQVDAEKMAGKAGNTPFDKLPVMGRVRHMMKGGKIIY